MEREEGCRKIMYELVVHTVANNMIFTSFSLYRTSLTGTNSEKKLSNLDDKLLAPTSSTRTTKQELCHTITDTRVPEFLTKQRSQHVR